MNIMANSVYWGSLINCDQRLFWPFGVIFWLILAMLGNSMYWEAVNNGGG